MKRTLITLGIIIVLAVGGTWIFIPQKLKIGSTVTYNANGQAVFDFLMADSNWKKWWPGTVDDSAGKSVLHYSTYKFQIEKILYNAFEFKLIKEKGVFDTALFNLIPIDVDSTAIEMVSEVDGGLNPIGRIRTYYTAKEMKETFDTILTSLASHTKELKNIYGFDIHKEKVQMQFLLQSSMETDHYPITEEIYSLIGKMRDYLKTTDGKEEFAPMLNIELADSTHWLVRVGLPVNKNLPGTKDIAMKQMVKNGNILVTDVQGGIHMIEQAIKQTEKYISDHKRSIIAIPFQSLETDRMKVTDTIKWVTKIFYPVV